MTIEERAQQVRQKRLAEREAEKRAEEERQLQEVEELAKWILNLLENPGQCNTKDMVEFTQTKSGNIQLMCRGGKLETTDKFFKHEVIIKLEELFNAQEGFNAFYMTEKRNVFPTFKVEIV